MTRKKILLVDDAETILMMERMILNKRTYELVTAKDGEEALTKACDEQPDLILLDVIMPKMNGFEVCHELRKNEKTSSIPVIMVTTRGEAENVEIGYERGCNDYVTKPINRMELLKKVRNIVGD